MESATTGEEEEEATEVMAGRGEGVGETRERLRSEGERLLAEGASESVGVGSSVCL